MPTFDTPAPIHAVLDLTFGQVRIVAGDRAETTVEAYPRDSDDREDLRTAEHLHVDCADGHLFVAVTEPGANGGAVVVVMTVPTGSSVDGRGRAVDFLGMGELGDCRLSTGLGRITLDRAERLQLAAALGDIRVGSAAGSVEATADRGDVHLGHVGGSATVTALSEGDATVDEVHGAARLYTENGAVRIGRAHADVEATAAQGDIDIDGVVRGSVVATSTFGSILVRVAGHSGVRLCLDSAAGTVYRSLSVLAAGEGADEVVWVRARTVIGDIVVERSSGDDTPQPFRKGL